MRMISNLDTTHLSINLNNLAANLLNDTPIALLRNAACREHVIATGSISCSAYVGVLYGLPSTNTHEVNENTAGPQDSDCQI